jgi:ribosomal protein L11 methyltransferase
MLEGYVKGGERLLDLGCGSGILSIAAMLLGAESAYAVDIDPNSVRIAKQNAEKNHITAGYTATAGNIITDKALAEKIGTGYDVVCANIVADVLIAMSGLFAGFLKKGGKLVVSGIIEPRRDEVLEKIQSSGFELVQTRQKDDWVAASFVYR